MALLQKLKNANGSVLVENLICFNATLILFLGSLVIFYVLMAQLWLQFWVHESLICIKQEENASFCQQELEKNFSPFFKFGRIIQFHVVQQTHERTEVEVQWSLTPQKIFQINRHIRWPQVLRKKAFSL